jgi:hypothetical protein
MDWISNISAFDVLVLLVFVAFLARGIWIGFISLYLIKLIGLGLKKVMDVTLTPWFDKTVGGLFGLIKGFFFVNLVFLIAGSFVSGTNNYIKKSASYPALSASSKVILAFIQDQDMRSYFIPKEPAISLPLLNESSENDKDPAPIVSPEEEEVIEESQPTEEEKKIYL